MPDVKEIKTLTKPNSEHTKLYGFSYLGGVGISKKFKKNVLVSKQYTYGLYLAPHKVSGYNTCPYSTPECRVGCLFNSGYGGMNKKVKDARVNRTILFFENRDKFMEILIDELTYFQKRAKKDNYNFSVRLNGTSDIEWENVYYKGKTVFEHFPDVQFYDYTKNPKRMLFSELPKNYNLTLSYTGRNTQWCFDVLNKGMNVAVVFNVTGNVPLPETWKGYKVVDGDITDYRPDDLKGIVIGLHYKNLTNDKRINTIIRKSIFVQQIDTDNVQYVEKRFRNKRLKVIA